MLASLTSDNCAIPRTADKTYYVQFPWVLQLSAVGTAFGPRVALLLHCAAAPASLCVKLQLHMLL